MALRAALIVGLQDRVETQEETASSDTDSKGTNLTISKVYVKNHTTRTTLLQIYNSPWLTAPLRSGMHMILTTKLVHPVKCCVRCPSPLSGLYCSHANPVVFQLL